MQSAVRRFRKFSYRFRRFNELEGNAPWKRSLPSTDLVQHLALLNCAQRGHDKDRSLVLCSTSLGVRCSCSLYSLHFGLKYVAIVSSPEQFLRE
nr:unnamed protein product [Haemonchus contortus]